MHYKPPARLVGSCVVAALSTYGLTIATLGLWRGLHSGAQPSSDQLAGFACALAAWAVVAWLVAGLVLTMVAAAPGTIGRFGRRWVVRIAPTAIRTTLGLTLGVVPVTLAPAHGVPAPASESTYNEPIIDRPLGSAVDPLDAEQASDDPSDATPAGKARDERDHVTVKAGDSLWSIAESHLGDEATIREIAAEWPRWFAANRDEIGPDPNLLHVGTTLTAPHR